MTFSIVKDYVPGCVGRIAELHGTYYHEHAGFGLYFETKVAAELSAFLQRYNEETDGLWLLRADDRIEGCVAIECKHAGDGAHLRWFIVSDRLRGRGAGNTLLATARAFCVERKFSSVQLWTFEGLHAARHLYEKHGFRLMEERRGNQWGSEVTEQRFELLLHVQ
jgi:N-acetylglutamate synthase-like GNAT family acetyltransferase